MAEYLCEEDMSTGEYISRDLALRQLNATCLVTDCDNYNGVRCRACAYADAMDFIDTIPAADVEPVKHGHWTYPYKDKDINQCSECHSCVQDKISNVREMFAYCPFCGARMDVIYEDDKVRSIKVTGWDDDTRNLTDEETDIYNNRLEAEAETIDEISLL